MRVGGCGSPSYSFVAAVSGSLGASADGQLGVPSSAWSRSILLFVNMRRVSALPQTAQTARFATALSLRQYGPGSALDHLPPCLASTVAFGVK